MDRRRFLAVTAGAAGAASGTGAGCLGFDGAGDSGDAAENATATRSSPRSTVDATAVSRPLDGSIRPESDPETVPDSLQCNDDSMTRLPLGDGGRTVAWGDADGLALRTDRLDAEYGDSVTVTLTNTTAGTVHTGNETTYGFELYTESGWQDVRVTPNGTPKPYAAVAIAHNPGEGFQWTFELTEEGIVDAPIHDDSFTVCPDLESGRYRFVYWGLPEADADAVAVAFDLQRTA